MTNEHKNSKSFPEVSGAIISLVFFVREPWQWL